MNNRYMIYTPLLAQTFSKKIKSKIDKGLKPIYAEKDVKVFLRKEKLEKLSNGID